MSYLAGRFWYSPLGCENNQLFEPRAGSRVKLCDQCFSILNLETQNRKSCIEKLHKKYIASQLYTFRFHYCSLEIIFIFISFPIFLFFSET